MRRPKVLALLAVFAGCVLLAAPAVAEQSPNVDCSAHDHLTEHYTITQLRSALSSMTADEQEYTNCVTIINNQLLAQLGTSVPTGNGNVAKTSGGGSFISAPLVIAFVVIVLGGVGAALAARRRGAGRGGTASR